MKRWRHITVWYDYAVFWRGQDTPGRAYKLTPERRQRLEALLGDAITPAAYGQGWLWSWNDWNWAEIAGGRHEAE